jgi:hypothetical protein
VSVYGSTGYRSTGLSGLSAALLASALLCAPAVAAPHTQRPKPTAQASTHPKTGKTGASAGARAGRSGRHGGRAAAAAAPSHKLHGQQAIAPERVSQIQEALIREHYLPGPANGEWNSTTLAAMQKYQSDQGWQTKLMPDSRALKKLGLGADYSNAINANGSSFAAPPPTSTIPDSQASGFTAASGVRQ